MTALAIPLFMIAASRWLWRGFWLNAAVSVSLGSFIFLWPLPGAIKEAFVFDLMGVPLAFAVNLLSFLIFGGGPADPLKGGESPADLREGLWPRGEARLLGAPLALVGAKEGRSR